MERYELPERWEWRRLGDKTVLRDIQPGFACGKKDVIDGIPHLRMNNISKDGFLYMSLVRRIPKEIAEKAGKWLEPGDIIFNNTNSTELVGKTCFFPGWKERCTFSNHLTRLRCNPEALSSEWLYVCLRDLWLSGYFATNCVEFVGQSAFNVNKLKEVEIPVPPLPEQRRIVKRIEQLTRRVEESRKLRTANLENMSRLLPAATETCFQGDDGWLSVPFGKAVKRVKSRGEKLKTEDYKPSGAIPIVDQGQSEIVGYTDRGNALFQGPIPVIIFGDHTKNIKYIDFDFAVGADGVVILRPIDDIVPEYFYYWLKSIPLHSLGYSRHYKLLKEQIVYFPEDKAEQGRIVEYLNGLQSKAEELKQLQADMEEELAALTPALLAKAFRGEL